MGRPSLRPFVFTHKKMSTETQLTNTQVASALRRRYPHRVRTILHIDRKPLEGGISKARREQMRVWFHNPNGGVEEMTLIAKEAPKSAHAIMTALIKRQDLKGRVPTPLLYTSGILLYRTLWGDELRRFPFAERDGTELERYTTEAADILSAIHTTTMPHGLKLETRSTAERRNHVATLKRKFPHVAKRFPLTSPLTPSNRPQRLIHGDFQASNLIVTLPDGRLGIVDFAAGGRGDPATDVASFLIHTQLMLRGVVPAVTVQRAMQSFTARYRKRAGTPGKDFDQALFTARFDVLLSILGTTVAHLTPQDKNYEPILRHLSHLFHNENMFL